MKTENFSSFLQGVIHRLYPTFKEWKHKKEGNVMAEELSLYPTFKEWKLRGGSLTPSFFFIVYILPLRNENYVPHQLQ